MADLNAPSCLFSLALVLATGAWPGTAAAGVVSFTDRSAFDAALLALPDIATTASEGYDSHAPGLTISNGASLGSLTYTYETSGNNLANSGVSLRVSTGFGTTSPANYLGTSDGGIFQSGDDFSLVFGPAKAVGMYFVSNDVLLDGDITLNAGTATASLVVADEQPFGLPDGRVYFLGLIDDTSSFTGVKIKSYCAPCGSFLFNIDDVVTAQGPVPVPVPATLPLALTALGLLGLSRAHRRVASC